MSKTLDKLFAILHTGMGCGAGIGLFLADYFGGHKFIVWLLCGILVYHEKFEWKKMCQCFYLKKVDLTGLSMSLFTGTQGTYLCHNANMLMDFYPPANINKAFNISAANLLSHDSIIRIFNNLANVTGTVKLTMGSVNMSKVSASEIAIATAKGWTVSAS